MEVFFVYFFLLQKVLRVILISLFLYSMQAISVCNCYYLNPSKIPKKHICAPQMFQYIVEVLPFTSSLLVTEKLTYSSCGLTGSG